MLRGQQMKKGNIYSSVEILNINWGKKVSVCIFLLSSCDSLFIAPTISNYCISHSLKFYSVWTECRYKAGGLKTIQPLKNQPFPKKYNIFECNIL